MGMRYRDFAHLRAYEQEGVDFVIRHRPGVSGVLVMAPHAGGIEPGTGAIAEAVAEGEHALYCFKGIKPAGNRVLHITSNRFEESLATRMLQAARWVLTIHGCRDEAPIAWVGGRDTYRGEAFIAHLNHSGIPARRCQRPGLRGLRPDNLCNRGRSGSGVQLEISIGLRRKLFSNLDKRSQRLTTPLFRAFVQALRDCLKAVLD